MEGKERFTDLHYLDNQIFVYDNKLKSKRVIGIEECFELLNQQDARIKELEEQLSTATMYHGCEALVNELKQENQQLKEKYDNLYKCYQKTSQEDLKDKYDLAEKNEELKAENKRLKEKISTQLQNNADNVDFMENQRREIERLKEKLKDIKNNYRRQIDSLLIERLNLFKQLKQSQKQLAIEKLKKLRPLITRQTYICGGKATENEIVEANAYNRCLADIRAILDNQIKQLEVQV